MTTYKYWALGALALIVLGVASFSIYRGATEEAPTNSSAKLTWVSAPVFSDTETGFTLKMPQAWQDISYRVERVEMDDTTIVFNFILPSRDKHGDLTSFVTGSTIKAMPSSTYLPERCLDDEPLCNPGEEIGRNSEYVFLSIQSSPEAFGNCTTIEGFYATNKRLCDEGSTLRNPERVKGAFMIAEVDPLVVKGTGLATVAFTCEKGKSFIARIQLMPVASQLGQAEVTLPDGTRRLLQQVPFAEAPDPRYENADGSFAFQTDTSITDGGGQGTFLEENGIPSFTKCSEIKQ